MSSYYRLVKILNVIGFLVTLVVNVAANALPLNGVTTGELSDKYGNLFTPAGYVFAIWGIIYFLLAAFTYYQFTEKDDDLFRSINWLFVITSFFNSVWIFFWHYEYLFLSLIAMVGLLVSLIFIYTRLKIGIEDVSRKKKYMVHMPFSVYLGWITVAPIANVSALLVALGWNANNATAIYITVVMILIALTLTLVNINVRGDVAYSAVLVWALGGIVQKQIDTYLIPWVAGFSIVTIIVILVLRKRS
jgi:hypothetical protein